MSLRLRFLMALLVSYMQVKVGLIDNKCMHLLFVFRDLNPFHYYIYFLMEP